MLDVSLYGVLCTRTLNHIQRVTQQIVVGEGKTGLIFADPEKKIKEGEKKKINHREPPISMCEANLLGW